MRSFWMFSAAAGSLLALAAPATAQLGSIDFGALPYTDISTMETVDVDGNSTFDQAGSSFPLKIEGVVLNNPGDMLDSTPDANTIPFNLGGQWQIFVQTIDVNNDGDFGGMAVYAGQNYGNIPPALTFDDQGNPVPDPSQSYGNTAWSADVSRISNSGTVKAGDLVEIDAQAGLSFGGKFNINEAHSTSSNDSFGITILNANYGLPAAIPLTISQIWNGTTNSVNFSSDRTLTNNAEHYQGDLVSLNSVHLAPNQTADWVSSGLVTVQDAAGRLFTVQVGTNSQFTPANAPAGWFNATGIFDQEAPAAGPNTGSYEVWVMNPTDFHLVALAPGDANGDGVVNGLDISQVASQWLQIGTNLLGDVNNDSVVNGLDIALIASHWLQTSGAGGGATSVPEPASLSLAVVGAAISVLSLFARRRGGRCTATNARA